MNPQAGTSIPRLNATKLLSHPDCVESVNQTKCESCLGARVTSTTMKMMKSTTCKIPAVNSSHGMTQKVYMFINPTLISSAHMIRVRCHLSGVYPGMFSAIKACRSAASPEVLPARADTQANQVTQPRDRCQWFCRSSSR